MLEQGVALPQAQLAGADVQDPAPVDASGAVSVPAAAFSGLAGVS